MGFIGGTLGDTLLNWIAPREDSRNYLSGSAYSEKSKLAALLGERFFDEIQGKTVVDFGCGTGREAVEMATRGAARIIGVDIRESSLETARLRAVEAGVADRCLFVTTAAQEADIVVSLDSFEHFEDPAEILRVMDHYLAPTGKAVVSFGPPWFHPLGGHLFSVFPWAHLVFTESALLKWRKRFRPHQTARTITECGLNKMTLRRFERIVADSPFRFERYEIRPIRGHRWLKASLLREFGTSIVTCTLTRRAPTAAFAVPQRAGQRQAPGLAAKVRLDSAGPCTHGGPPVPAAGDAVDRAAS